MKNLFEIDLIQSCNIIAGIKNVFLIWTGFQSICPRWRKQGKRRPNAININSSLSRPHSKLFKTSSTESKYTWSWMLQFSSINLTPAYFLLTFLSQFCITETNLIQVLVTKASLTWASQSLSGEAMVQWIALLLAVLVARVRFPLTTLLGWVTIFRLFFSLSHLRP